MTEELTPETSCQFCTVFQWRGPLSTEHTYTDNERTSSLTPHPSPLTPHPSPLTLRDVLSIPTETFCPVLLPPLSLQADVTSAYSGLLWLLHICPVKSRRHEPLIFLASLHEGSASLSSFFLCIRLSLMRSPSRWSASSRERSTD